MSGSDDKYKTLYHYTDTESAKKIKSTGTVKASTAQKSRDDVTFGDNKAYFTDMPPSHSRHSIAKNNYDDGPKLPRQRIAEGKLDAVVEAKVRKDKIEDHSYSGRRVQTYDGALDLKGKDVKSYNVYKNKPKK